MNDIKGIKKLLRKRRPRPFENLQGYIVRHTELNCWEQSTWLLDYAKISKDRRHNTSLSFIFNRSLDLTTLGYVTCTDTSQLYQMLYSPIENDNKMVKFMGHPISKYAITTKPGICPECLRQDNYIRTMWDLSLVTCCPTHNCQLIDTCPNCGKRLSWYRSKVSCCNDGERCGFDFRDIPTTKVANDDTYLATHLYALIGLPNIQSPLALNNPIMGLSLNGIFKFASFLASNYSLRKLDPEGLQFSKATTIEQRHRAIQAISPILCQWPDGFHNFIDENRSQNYRGHRFGLIGNFGKKYVQLTKHFFKDEFNFIRQAFETYLRNWDAGYITSKNKWFKAELCQINTVSMAQSCSILKTKSPIVNKLVEQGSLKATVIAGDRRRLIQIDRHSIDRLQHERSKCLTIKEAADHLNISIGFVRALLRADIIQSRLDLLFDRQSQTLLERDVIDKLFNDFHHLYYHYGVGIKSVKLIGFMHAYHFLRIHGYSFVQFIRLILSGKIIPCDVCPDLGLKSFSFDKPQIETILIPKIRYFGHGHISVKEAANKLELRPIIVLNFVKLGLLKTGNTVISEKESAISVKSLNKFVQNYVIGQKKAAELGLHIHSFNNLLRARGIMPISGYSVGSGLTTLYLRKDIDRLDFLPPNLVNTLYSNPAKTGRRRVTNRKKYEKEFKLKAVRLAAKPGRSADKVERDLGIGRGCICRWQRELSRYGEQAFPGHWTSHL